MLAYQDGGVCKAAPEYSGSSFFILGAGVKVELGGPNSGQMGLLFQYHGWSLYIADTVPVSS
jgi:hypothetical protein